MKQKERIEKIYVRYYRGKKLPYLGFIDGKEYPYNKRKRNQIIDITIGRGYNVMIQTYIPSLGEGFQIIWIDKYSFQPMDFKK